MAPSREVRVDPQEDIPLPGPALGELRFQPGDLVDLSGENLSQGKERVIGDEDPTAFGERHGARLRSEFPGKRDKSQFSLQNVGIRPDGDDHAGEGQDS